LACGIPRDEFDCENAAARLVHCCGGEFPHFRCNYVDGGCGGNSLYPLDPGESACILGASCDDLRSSGVCDRATEANPESSYQSGICPPGPAPEASAPVEVPVPTQCTRAADCPTGYLCCSYPAIGSGNYTGTSCVETVCGGNGIAVCSTSADCLDGGTCASSGPMAPNHCTP
jgi:hypothetical protein